MAARSRCAGLPGGISARPWCWPAWRWPRAARPATTPSSRRAHCGRAWACMAMPAWHPGSGANSADSPTERPHLGPTRQPVAPRFHRPDGTVMCGRGGRDHDAAQASGDELGIVDRGADPRRPGAGGLRQPAGGRQAPAEHGSDKLPDEATVRGRVAALNVEIARVNATVVEGPPTRLGKLDADQVVAKWRRTRSAAHG